MTEFLTSSEGYKPYNMNFAKRKTFHWTFHKTDAHPGSHRLPAFSNPGIPTINRKIPTDKIRLRIAKLEYPPGNRDGQAVKRNLVEGFRGFQRNLLRIFAGAKGSPRRKNFICDLTRCTAHRRPAELQSDTGENILYSSSIHGPRFRVRSRFPCACRDQQSQPRVSV